MNLHLPRFDELKVDETLDFISASTFLEEYLHLSAPCNAFIYKGT